MAVQEGDKVPAATFKVMGAAGPADVTSEELSRRQDSGTFLGSRCFYADLFSQTSSWIR